MRKVNFIVYDTKDKEHKMTVVIGDGDKPYVLYNDEKYEGYNPGEVFTGDMIKNPKPLPAGTYGFVVGRMAFVYQHSIIGGNTFMILNPGYEIGGYKGANRAIKITKVLIGIGLVAIAIVSLIMVINA